MKGYKSARFNYRSSIANDKTVGHLVCESKLKLLLKGCGLPEEEGRATLLLLRFYSLTCRVRSLRTNARRKSRRWRNRRREILRRHRLHGNHRRLLANHHPNSHRLPWSRRRNCHHCRPNNRRLREKCRRSCRHHRLLRTTAAQEHYDKSAPGSKDNCDSLEPNRMESCETSAPNDLVPDDMTAWYSRDSSRRRYRHCCDTSVRSRSACSYPTWADYRRRWMADGNRRSTEPPRVHWTQRSAASRMPGQRSR